jgi:hypothetical protein
MLLVGSRAVSGRNRRCGIKAARSALGISGQESEIEKQK